MNGGGGGVGIRAALAAQATGDKITARQLYQQFLALCKNADLIDPKSLRQRNFWRNTSSSVVTVRTDYS